MEGAANSVNFTSTVFAVVETGFVFWLLTRFCSGGLGSLVHIQPPKQGVPEGLSQGDIFTLLTSETPRVQVILLLPREPEAGNS